LSYDQRIDKSICFTNELSFGFSDPHTLSLFLELDDNRPVTGTCDVKTAKDAPNNQNPSEIGFTAIIMDPPSRSRNNLGKGDEYGMFVVGTHDR
jgi:hypothetical protein